MILKKFAMLVTSFVLAPLGSLLTPTAAHADYSYSIGWQRCVFPSILNHDYTLWNARITVRSSDQAAHVTEIKFGNGNEEKIRVLEFWESHVVNGVTNPYSKKKFTFNPPITEWKSSISTTWISTLGNRYVNVKLSHEDGRNCTSRIEF